MKKGAADFSSITSEIVHSERRDGKVMIKLTHESTTLLIPEYIGRCAEDRVDKLRPQLSTVPSWLHIVT